MPRITADATMEELAANISQALDAASITATLSGGSAVSIYTHNEYQSEDLDFVTAASHKELRSVIEPLSFAASRNSRQFEHPGTHWLIEFPPSPLGFGELVVDARRIPVLQTAYGPLRDRSAAVDCEGLIRRRSGRKRGRRDYRYLAIEQAGAMAGRPLEQSQVRGLHEMLTRETLDDVSVAGRPQTPDEERVEVVDNRGLIQGNAQRLTSKRDSSSRGFSHSGSSSAASR